MTEARPLGNTEHSWCRAVSSGTGITVLALQIARPPTENAILQKVLQNLQKNHPILKSKLSYNPSTKEYTFDKSKDKPQIKIEFHDGTPSNPNPNISPLHSILEHEMNAKNWVDPNRFPCGGIDVLFASVYSLPNAKFAIVLRFHASICDRTTAVTLLREMMELVKEIEREGGCKEIKNECEGSLGIESLVPSGLKKKSLWCHGKDMLGYSVNSLRLTNLKFMNTKGERRSEVVRLKMNTKDTAKILDGCKTRGIKLCGALSAAGLISAHSSKITKKYGVVTMTDCRSSLEPALSSQHFGFYHSTILNSHAIKSNEKFWDLATRIYDDFTHSKNNNKHFSDMADLNFLMCKAIENPNLTASSSLRTALISVFEDPVFDNSSQMQKEIYVEDYIGYASVHGVGPSIALFDTIRDGELDCACVYASPLHSREQMNEIVDHMRKVMIEESN